MILQKFLVYLTVLIALPCSMVASADWHYAEDVAMTTSISVELWSESEEKAKELQQAVFAEFHRVEAKMTTYKESSELSKVNREAFSKPISVSEELFRLLQQSRQVSVLTDGAFDMTFGSLGRYYDYRKGETPTDEQISAYVGDVSYRNVLFDKNNYSVRYDHPATRVDLGGIAKGYAVDRAIYLLSKMGVTSARVSAGGDMRLLGAKGDRPWIVGVRDPRVETENAVLLPLSDVSVSTSGDYERFFIDDNGERIHHIISPATGKSVNHVQSVTIIGPDATTTDGLSTAVFVLGVSKGMELINRLEGIDAIIIDKDRKMHYSDDLMAPDAN